MTVVTRSVLRHPAISHARTHSAFGIAWIVVLSLSPTLRFVTTFTDGRLRLVIVALMALTAIAWKLRVPYGGPAWLVALILIPVAGLVSGQASSVPASVVVSISFALLVGLGPLIFRYFVTSNERWVRPALAGFLLVQTLSAVVGLLQVGTGLSVLGAAARSGRANGLAEHPNVLGLMATFAILIALAVWTQVERMSRLALLGIVTLNTAALLATGSLSNILALGAGGVVLLIARRAALRTVLGVVLTAVAVVPLAALAGVNPLALTDGVQDRVDVVTGESDTVGSLAIRQQTWAAAWDRIQDDPVMGSGMDPTNQAVYGSTVVHNFVLHYWYQGGLLLLVPMLGITGVLLAIVVRAIITGRDAGPAAVCAAAIAFAMTSAFYDQQYYWIPLLAAVAFVGTDAGARATRVGRRRASRVRGGGTRSARGRRNAQRLRRR